MEKQHILDEIRRTAAANGGAPLGRLQFFNETGIKEHDWRGVNWSRWSDAVSEAGLSPNQKTEAYEGKFLLDSLAGLIRDIKRFPTGSDKSVEENRHGLAGLHSVWGRLYWRYLLLDQRPHFLPQRSPAIHVARLILRVDAEISPCQPQF